MPKNLLIPKAHFIENDFNGKALPKKGKAKALQVVGAQVTDSTFKENLVCVIQQETRDLAFYVPDDIRRACLASVDYAEGERVWLILPNAASLTQD